MTRASPELSEEAEDGFAPISGLAQVVYCPRRAALIHVEQQWADDAATRSGTIVHERADLPGADHRHGVRVLRAVPLVSHTLRLRGRADFVELIAPTTPGVVAQPMPVEVKRGRRKYQLADRVQLCAQALCLEEMWSVAIPQGVVFYDASHRRVQISLDEDLRERTRAAIRELHRLLFFREVPAAIPGPKCRQCSLEPLCLPKAMSKPERASQWVAALMREGTGDADQEKNVDDD